MKTAIEQRTLDIAEYMVDTRATVRAAAKHYGVSKSTVHKDMSDRLKFLDTGLYEQVRKLLDENKSERHIRGGMATKAKYKNNS